MTESASSGLFETATDPDAVERAVAAAAPIAAERSDLAMLDSLGPSLREPVYRLMLSVADNKYVLGRRYAEWCTGAPMLESAVAAAAMAQDELGHARSFYPLLRGFQQGRNLVQMEDRGWQERSTSAMSCLDQRFSTWSDFVAANLLVDGALTTMLSAAVDSPYEPLRQRARKIQQEEAGHWVHAAGWLRRLQHVPSDPEEHPRLPLLAALSRVWDDAFTWFGQPNDPVLAALVSSGLLSATPEALRQTLIARVEPLLAQLDPSNALQSRTLPWNRWNAPARRLTAVAPE